MLTLQNVHTLAEGIKDIQIKDGKISNVSPASTSDQTNTGARLYFDNAIVFPGLINSHDHLDFNLFPRLGNGIYKNYLEWGDDIHRRQKNIIDSVLQVPKTLRTQWGVYKNLLNGFTTVFNHGDPLEIENPLIDIFQDKNSLHSVRLEKNWKWKLNNPFNNKEPYVIHVGEGTDTDSHREIDTLLRWNKLHKKLIGIHGVAMDERQAPAFEALVWCPDSNLFLLGATAAIDKLKRRTVIVFGTDSTVSADWNAWAHLRVAKNMGLLTVDELFGSVTTSPAKLRGLHGIGMIKENFVADIVIAEKKGHDAFDAFFNVNPDIILAVVKHGNVVLFDESLLSQFTAQNLNVAKFSRICVNGRFKYVKGDLNHLIGQVKQYSKDIVVPVEPE